MRSLDKRRPGPDYQITRFPDFPMLLTTWVPHVTPYRCVIRILSMMRLVE
jgi:hypothetical protein